MRKSGDRSERKAEFCSEIITCLHAQRAGFEGCRHVHELVGERLVHILLMGEPEER